MKMNLLFISPLLFWHLLHHGASGVDIDEVLLMEGDSVTLLTGVKTNQQDRIRWYFNDSLIALITGDLHKICTDVQCDDDMERFRDRLELDHQTGCLIITNTTTTDSGDYKLLISSSNIESENRFSVIVHGVPAAEPEKTKRKLMKEGESFTLHSDGVNNPNTLKIWHFKDTHIAEITGDQSKICTDDQCKERFRDRLQLDQTGSLTITNTTTTDSGLYQLQINSSRFDIIKTFSVTVTAGPDSTVAAAAAVLVGAVLLVGATSAIYCHCRPGRKNGNRKHHNNQDLENGEGAKLLNQAQTTQMIVADRTYLDHTDHSQTDAAKEKPADHTENKPKGASEEKPTNHTDNKPKGAAEEKPTDDTDSKPKGAAEEKPTDHTDNKLKSAAEEKPTDHTDNKLKSVAAGEKPTDHTDNKLAGTAGEKRADHTNNKPKGAAGEQPADHTNNKLVGTAGEKPADHTDNKSKGAAREKAADHTDNLLKGAAGEKPADHNDNKPGETPADHTDNKPKGAAEEKPTDHTDNKLADTTGEKPTDDTDNKLAGTAGEKTADHTDNKPKGAAGEKDHTDNKPKGAAGAKPADHTDKKTEGCY